MLKSQPNNADVNADCTISVIDYTYLVAYLFGGGPDPLPGCVEGRQANRVSPGASLVTPRRFEVSQNYPNPFNPITRISFSIPEAGDVTLEVFNIRGQKVATLVDGTLRGGDHIAIWNASGVSSGVYFYRLTTGDAVVTKKMVLLK